MAVFGIDHCATLPQKASDPQGVALGGCSGAIALEASERVDLSAIVCDPDRVTARTILFPSWLFGRDKDPVANVRTKDSREEGDGFLIEPMEAPHLICGHDLAEGGEVFNLHFHLVGGDVGMNACVIRDVLPIVADDDLVFWCVHIWCVVRP